MSPLRPSFYFVGYCIVLLCFLLVLQRGYVQKSKSHKTHLNNQSIAVATFGVSDLCLSTEARYTRHLMASDKVVVGMDHPGGLDHFPSTIFWAPVQ